jgi:hypothetical protein
MSCVWRVTGKTMMRGDNTVLGVLVTNRRAVVVTEMLCCSLGTGNGAASEELRRHQDSWKNIT